MIFKKILNMYCFIGRKGVGLEVIIKILYSDDNFGESFFFL